ncbi:MAG: 30S ribosomal protein S17 [Candidatus Magasanikbacteria bacterium CG10_big_fil_rev_8_21_14_0_10_40_10]|uniref:Small ribosomal subunit protein uS17 n=1 Tax=Candidatus Magasanikbacteria bacterium CG10_big_fil_rev_8_21_14_0_10_40_10 TaxID=1974648 RepID=A0A2M6W595_9BACT|nr:MAG: 30S ribosomal protein S17 [Candidatus Magasanikbacteria bacterium CG10_big_fil_rev_8_21_14_0_10_40_10]
MEKTKQIKKRKFTGTVVKTAMNKTISVLVVEKRVHPKYGKAYKQGRKFHVHDEKQAAKEGEKVVFVECRPLSKTKRWRLLEIVKSTEKVKK